MESADKIESKTETNETKETDELQTKEDKKQESQDPIIVLEEKLESAQKETEQVYDRLLRVSAEFENYKKRTSREKDELRKYANEALFMELLSVADNLERAVDSATQEHGADSDIVKGVDMIIKEIINIFAKFSVKPIDSLEKEFDPKFHQAMMQEPSAKHSENTVIKELQKGYMIHDRLLRPAMVIVSKAESEEKK